jgi:hypothetical protein
MKNETTVTKLTAAQVQARQAKADRRADALLRAADGALRADNKRIDAMYALPVKAQPKKAPKATKKVRWTGAELDYLVTRYLVHFNKADGTVNYGAINDEFAVKFPQRGTTGVQMAICQIRGLDTWVAGEGLTDTSQSLIDKLYSIDSVRFPGGATKEDKIVNALDNLLAEIRG